MLFQKFFRYHDHLYSKRLKQARKIGRSHITHNIPYVSIFLKCSTQCFNVFFNYFVTLAVFPAIYSEIKMVDPNFIIEPRYFTAVTCFLTFNLFAVIGNLIPSWTCACPKPRWVFIPVVLRFLFIPFFLLCNYQPSGAERQWPILFYWDYAYWGAGAIFGLSGGYLSTLAMMYCPRYLDLGDLPCGLFKGT